MNPGTWYAIARRQAWYVLILEKNLAEWPKERIDACGDLETLRGVLTLAKRVDRHEQLMIRHLRKGVSFRQDGANPLSSRVSRKSTRKTR